MADHATVACGSRNGALQKAAALGQLSTVNDLLVDDAVNPATASQAAVRAAASAGHWDVVNRLLDDGRVDPSACGSQALVEAVLHGHLPTVQRLLSDARVDPTANNCAAGCAAARRGHAFIFQLLLPFMDSAAVNTALVAACSADHLPIVELLLEHPLADPTACGRKHSADEADAGSRCLRKAAWASTTRVLARLVHDPRIDPSAGNSVALAKACERGDVDLAALLLSDPRVDCVAQQHPKPADSDSESEPASEDEDEEEEDGEDEDEEDEEDVDAVDWMDEEKEDEGDTDVKDDDLEILLDLDALHAACAGGFTAVVARLLTDPRIRPSFGNYAALATACRRGHTAVVQLLIAHIAGNGWPAATVKAPQTERKRRRKDAAASRPPCESERQAAVLQIALLSAARGDALELVEWLLASHGEILYAIGAVDAAFRRACYCGSLAVLDRLLADPRVDPAHDDNKPLRKACRGGQWRAVERLLDDPGVDPSVLRQYAIRAAAASGPVHLVERLLADPRVDPAACSNRAIRSACTAGNTNAAMRLLADPRVDPTAMGNEALSSACREGHGAAAELLLADARVASSDWADAGSTLGDVVDSYRKASSWLRQRIAQIAALRKRGNEACCDPSEDEVDAPSRYRRVLRCLLRDGRVRAAAKRSLLLRAACLCDDAGTVELLMRPADSGGRGIPASEAETATVISADTGGDTQAAAASASGPASACDTSAASALAAAAGLYCT